MLVEVEEIENVLYLQPTLYKNLVGKTINKHFWAVFKLSESTVCQFLLLK